MGTLSEGARAHPVVMEEGPGAGRFRALQTVVGGEMVWEATAGFRAT